MLPVYGTVSYLAHFLHLCALWIFYAWSEIECVWSAPVCYVKSGFWAVLFTTGLSCTVSL